MRGLRGFREFRGFRGFSGLRILEKILIRITMMGLVLLIASQLLITGSSTTMLDFKVPNYAGETQGTRAAVGQNIGEKSYVTFALEDYSSLNKAVIYVNGRKRTDLSEKYATISVYKGDLVEIDTSFYEKPVSIRIVANDETAVSLPEGEVLLFESERRVLK